MAQPNQPNDDVVPGQVGQPRPSGASIFAQRGKQREEMGAASDSEAELMAKVGLPAGEPAIKTAPVDGTPTTESLSKATNPATLTGNETADELQQLGFSSEASHKRIKDLAGRANAAEGETERLRAEVEQLRIQAQQAPPTSQEPPAPRDIPVEEYEVPYPNDGTYEEQEAWRLEDLIHRISQKNSRKEVMAMTQNIGTVFGPLLQKDAMSERDAGWAEIEDGLKELGTSREELEPYVKEVLKRQPDRGVQDAAFQVLEHATGRSPWAIMQDMRPAATPQVPAAAVPGGGRTVPAGKSGAEPSLSDQLASTQVGIRKDAASGNTRQARHGVRNMFRLRGQMNT